MIKLKKQNKAPALATSIIWNWGTQAVNIIISFILVRILLVRLGSDSYGVWILIGSIIGYFQLLEFGITSAIVKFISQCRANNDAQGVAKYFSTSFAFYSCIALIIIIISMLLSFFPPQLLNIPENLYVSFKWLIFICGLSIAILFFGNTFNATLRAYERFDYLNISGLFLNIFKILIIYAFLSKSILFLGYIQLGVSFVSLIINVFLCKKVLGKIPLAFNHISKKTGKSIFSFSIYSFLIVIANMIRFSTDSIVISYFIGVSSVTVFYIGHRLLNLIRDMASQISTPFLPRFSFEQARDIKQVHKTFLKITRITAFISTICFGTAIGSGMQFIDYWAGNSHNSYSLSYTVLCILAFPAFLGISQIISISYFYATFKHKVLAGLTVFEAIGNIVLSVILVNFFGIIGVALGTAIPMLFTKGFVQPFYINRFTKISLFKYYKTFLFIPISFVAPIICLQFAFFYYIPTDHIISIIVLVCISLIIYVPIFFFFYFDKEEKSWFVKYASEWIKR